MKTKRRTEVLREGLGPAGTLTTVRSSTGFDPIVHSLPFASVSRSISKSVRWGVGSGRARMPRAPACRPGGRGLGSQARGCERCGGHAAQ